MIFEIFMGFCFGVLILDLGIAVVGGIILAIVSVQKFINKRGLQ